MPLDKNKQQTYYIVTVWFKHKTKRYTLSDFDKLDSFLSKADQNETVIHYMVESVSKFIYPEYQAKKYRKFLNI